MLVSRIHNTGSPRCTPLWYPSFQFNNVTPKLSHKLQYLSLKMSYIEDYMACIRFFRCTLHFTLDVSYFRYTLSHSNGYCDGYRGLAVHRLGWKTIRHILTFATFAIFTFSGRKKKTIFIKNCVCQFPLSRATFRKILKTTTLYNIEKAFVITFIEWYS